MAAAATYRRGGSGVRVAIPSAPTALPFASSMPPPMFFILGLYVCFLCTLGFLDLDYNL